MKYLKNAIWFLSVMMSFFMIAGCSDKSKSETGGGSSTVPSQATSGEEAIGSEAITLTALKMVQLDNGEVDLLAGEPFTSFPLRPQYFEAQFSADVDCDTAKTNFMLMEGDTQIADVQITCPEANKLRMALTKNLAHKTDYKIHLGAWENFEGKEAPFHTMTKGDVNGDGVADIAVGAPGYDSKGALYVYSGKNIISAGTPEDALIGLIKGSGSFGQSIAKLTDINGDGFADIIVGAPGYESKGAVFVYSGSELTAGRSTLIGQPIEKSDATEQSFGYSVAVADDINGDGIPDIVVGAPMYDSNNGMVGVYSGKELAQGTLAQIGPFVMPHYASASLGSSVADGGDVDGDGVSDIIVGAPMYDSGKGAMGVYSGKELFAGSQKFVGGSHIQIGDINCCVGFSVAGGGDINRNGVPEIIVGGPCKGSSRGATAVYEGEPLIADSSGMWLIELTTPEYNHSMFGYSVAGGSDIDADGKPEVIVGAPYKSDGKGVMVFSGNKFAEGVLTPTWYVGDVANIGFGSAVAFTNDIDGDGVPDIIVGAPKYNGYIGSAAVYSGKGVAAGLTQRIGPILTITEAAAHFGTSVNGGQ